MATNENEVTTRLREVEKKSNSLERQISNLATKVDLFIEESRENRQRQDADIRELRKKIDELKFAGMYTVLAIEFVLLVVAVLTK